MILHTVDSQKWFVESLQWYYSMDHNRMNFHSTNSLYSRQCHWKMMPNNWIYRHNCNDHGIQIGSPLKWNHRLNAVALHDPHRLYRHLSSIVLCSGYICRYYIWKWSALEYSVDTMSSSSVCYVVDPKNNHH